MIVALSVTGTLLLFTILVIVCCFWSKCPLYTTCRAKYDKDDIIATGTMHLYNKYTMDVDETSDYLLNCCKLIGDILRNFLLTEGSG